MSYFSQAKAFFFSPKYPCSSELKPVKGCFFNTDYPDMVDNIKKFMCSDSTESTNITSLEIRSWDDITLNVDGSSIFSDNCVIRISGIDAEHDILYRVVNQKTATQFACETYELNADVSSILGTVNGKGIVRRAGMGWSVVFESADELVIRGNWNKQQCLYIKKMKNLNKPDVDDVINMRDAVNNGATFTYTDYRNVYNSQPNAFKGTAHYDAICLTKQLWNWDSSLTPEENVERFIVTSWSNQPTEGIASLDRLKRYSNVFVHPCFNNKRMDSNDKNYNEIMKSDAMNDWFIVGDDKFFACGLMQCRYFNSYFNYFYNTFCFGEIPLLNNDETSVFIHSGMSPVSFVSGSSRYIELDSYYHNYGFYAYGGISECTPKSTSYSFLTLPWNNKKRIFNTTVSGNDSRSKDPNSLESYYQEYYNGLIYGIYEIQNSASAVILKQYPTVNICVKRNGNNTSTFKFPYANVPIYSSTVSYMVDGQGYLQTNSDLYMVYVQPFTSKITTYSSFNVESVTSCSFNITGNFREGSF